jgi:phosphoglycolate phosphatase
MIKQRKKLLLFDIDGTLMDSGGAGLRALETAFHELYGVLSTLKGITLAGNTDMRILDEVFNNLNIVHDDHKVYELKEAYLKHLSTEINNPSLSIKPGIKALLAHLLPISNVELGLLTGNVQEGAEIKLKAVEIAHYFSFGAYGSDHWDRNKLLPFAVDRYKSISGVDIPHEDCVIIGDTPLDVYCARPYGAKAIAVLTGYSTREAIQEAKPDAIMEDLSNIEEFMDVCGIR